MGLRLVWNFELVPKNTVSLSSFTSVIEEFKWEIRYFWPAEHIIKLYLIDSNLVAISNYKQKYKEDGYYLLPNTSYNIKLRGENILYKPLLKHANKAQGFGPKIVVPSGPKGEDIGQYGLKSLDPADSLREAGIFSKEKVGLLASNLPFDSSLIEREIPILVKKESFTYKFATVPQTKLELSRLEINDSIYFSVCIEGKSLELVELIDKHLFDKEHASDYVTFLKSISP